MFRGTTWTLHCFVFIWVFFFSTGFFFFFLCVVRGAGEIIIKPAGFACYDRGVAGTVDIHTREYEQEIIIMVLSGGLWEPVGFRSIIYCNNLLSLCWLCLTLSSPKSVGIPFSGLLDRIYWASKSTSSNDSGPNGFEEPKTCFRTCILINAGSSQLRSNSSAATSAASSRSASPSLCSNGTSARICFCLSRMWTSVIVFFYSQEAETGTTREREALWYREHL